MRGHDLHRTEVAAPFARTAGRTVRLPPLQQRFLALQRSAGNHAVTHVVRGQPTVQRCGPVACDCSPEERAEKEGRPAPRAVQRTADDGHDLTSPRFAGDPRLEACYDDEARLTLGATGPTVTTVQSALSDLGYDLGPTGTDGRYGRRTWDAVTAFKRDQALGSERMGDVGPGTIGRLDALFPGRHLPDHRLPPCPIVGAAIPVSSAIAGRSGPRIPGINCRISPHGRRRQTPGADPPPPAQGPWITLITVDLAAQRLTAQLSNQTVRSIQVSTGKGLCGTQGNPCAHAGANNDECTPPGTHFTVQSRHGRDYHGIDGAHHLTPQHHMAYYVGFADARGIGIHNSQIADGTPRSHGCVRVGTDTSERGFAFWLNTHVRVGQTAVHVTGVAAAQPHPCPTPRNHRHERQPQHRRR